MLAENRGNAGTQAQPLLQQARPTAKPLLPTSGHRAVLSPKELTRYFCSRQIAPMITTGTTSPTATSSLCPNETQSAQFR